jgi:simple sugar transport system permease protein
MAATPPSEESPDERNRPPEPRTAPTLPEGPPTRRGLAIPWRAWLTDMLVPVLAILTALLVGAVIIAATGASVVAAYSGLLAGALGGQVAIANTLVEATPYILAGLAVALGFKCGLFNIGVEGQLGIGAMCAAVAGAAFVGMPAIIHLPLAILCGGLGGALWGAVPGFLRARTGAHEVITTIMFNYISIRLTDYLIKGPFRDRSASAPRTPYIQSGADLPRVVGPGETVSPTISYQPLIVTENPAWDLRLHLGFLLALVMVVVIWWLLTRTTTGFEIRTVGANPDAAQYAGMSITRNFVLAMALSGGLAGLAGASQVLGLEHNLKASFSAGYGFDSIAIALLARSNPLGIIPAAIFWGALRNGAGLMQLQSGISSNLISIIQALVIVFVAADQIVRWIYRIRRPAGSRMVFTRGWGR